MKTKYLFKTEVKAKIFFNGNNSTALYPSFQEAPDETQGPEMEPTDSSFHDSFRAWMGA